MNQPMTAQEVIRHFALEPLIPEGGYFRQNYHSRHTTPTGKWQGTAIYYLLTPNTCSSMHVLPSDEVYHFYLGDPVELLLLYPDGHGEVVVLGQDIVRGMQVQFVVPAGVWQGSRLKEGGEWGLMGTTMAPGFDDADFVAGAREALTADYPAFANEIAQRTQEA